MYDGVPPDSTGTANEYYVYAKDASIPGTIGTGVYYFNLQNAHQGYTRWGMIFAEGENTNNSRINGASKILRHFSKIDCKMYVCRI